MTRSLALAFVSLTLMAGCTVKANKAETDEDSTEVAVRFMRESEVAAHLDATRTRLDSLRGEAAVLGTKVDVKMQEKIAQLEVEKDSAEVRFERLQQAGEEKWEDVRSGFAVMLDSLDVKIDRARRDIKGHG
jgi:TolA-binding protein